MVGTIAVSVSAIAVLAQGPTAEVALAIQPSALVRGRTSVVDVRVVVPDGRFVPAETRGALKGAWLQPIEAGLQSRALPTYPIPDFVRLPGSSMPVLAYSNAVTIRVPIDVAPGVRGRQALSVRFDYQLCDAASCRPIRSKTASTTVIVDEPSATDASLAPGLTPREWRLSPTARLARPIRGWTSSRRPRNMRCEWRHCRRVTKGARSSASHSASARTGS